jgi:hypothetical protein
MKNRNRAAQAFRMAAQSVLRADCVRILVERCH